MFTDDLHPFHGYVTKESESPPDRKRTRVPLVSEAPPPPVSPAAPPVLRKIRLGSVFRDNLQIIDKQKNHNHIYNQIKMLIKK